MSNAVDGFAGRVPTALALADCSNSVDGLACIGCDEYMLYLWFSCSNNLWQLVADEPRGLLNGESRS